MVVMVVSKSSPSLKRIQRFNWTITSWFMGCTWRLFLKRTKFWLRWFTACFYCISAAILWMALKVKLAVPSLFTLCPLGFNNIVNNKSIYLHWAKPSTIKTYTMESLMSLTGKQGHVNMFTCKGTYFLCSPQDKPQTAVADPKLY